MTKWVNRGLSEFKTERVNQNDRKVKTKRVNRGLSEFKTERGNRAVKIETQGVNITFQDSLLPTSWVETGGSC